MRGRCPRPAPRGARPRAGTAGSGGSKSGSWRVPVGSEPPRPGPPPLPSPSDRLTRPAPPPPKPRLWATWREPCPSPVSQHKGHGALAEPHQVASLRLGLQQPLGLPVGDGGDARQPHTCLRLSRATPAPSQAGGSGGRRVQVAERTRLCSHAPGTGENGPASRPGLGGRAVGEGTPGPASSSGLTLEGSLEALGWGGNRLVGFNVFLNVYF